MATTVFAGVGTGGAVGATVAAAVAVGTIKAVAWALAVGRDTVVVAAVAVLPPRECAKARIPAPMANRQTSAMSIGAVNPPPRRLSGRSGGNESVRHGRGRLHRYAGWRHMNRCMLDRCGGGSAASGRVSTIAGGWRPSRARRSAARISAADWYRCAGSFASALMTTASVAGAISGRIVRMGGGGSCTCIIATATSESPLNGTCPVSAS